MTKLFINSSKLFFIFSLFALLSLTVACSGPASTCPQGGCDQTCSGDCSKTCAGGGCTQFCPKGAACSFTCAKGNCKQTCKEGAKSCVVTCGGGNCDQDCGATAVCT